MRPFLFYRYTDGHSVPQLEISELPGLEEAMNFARRLLSADERRSRVDVVAGEIEVGRVERDGSHGIAAA